MLLNVIRKKYPPLLVSNRNMSRTTEHVIRMVLFVMLFQFLCPAFMPLIVQEIPTGKETAFHVQHTSIVAPMLLKEKDEKEDSDIFSVVAESAPILDLTSHSFNLTAAHGSKFSKFTEEKASNRPPRFALFCTLLI
jgi:hypothetical protein